MSLLLILTLSYLAILVLALAASLIAILVYLLRIGRRLDAVHTHLHTVQERTAPLSGPLSLLQEISRGSAQDLAQAGENLTRAGDHLAGLAGQAK